MRILIQRVKQARVEVDNKTIGAISQGLLLFVGIEDQDTQEDIDWLVNKTTNLRIFNDENGVMNRSLKEIDGDALVVSQFTLHASTKKGNRPSYIRAAKPDTAIPIYERFIQTFETAIHKKVATGQFGADMQVQLVNDGPVTIWIDSKNKE